MSGFADTTTVSPEKTRAEIETLIRKYKADAFSSGWDELTAWVGFRAADRLVKFRIVLPDPTDRRFTHDRNGWRRTDAAREKAYDQAVRTIWRRLLLCIKAKLESVASGIESFETAFAAHIVMPDGSTVGDLIRPAIAAAYASGKMPTRLLALPPATPSGDQPTATGPTLIIDDESK